MSIRSKQLLLLLGIALLPVILSGWQSLRRIDHMATDIAASTRELIVASDQRYMQEKVSDIGTSLVLITRATEISLKRQQLAIEKALTTTPPSLPLGILTSDAIPGHPDAVDDTRFSRSAIPGQSKFLKVYYPEPSFRLPADGCLDSSCISLVQRLNNATADLKTIFEQTGNYTLWHYAAMENGLSMSYPGHGDYPEEYDPRQRQWYKLAAADGGIIWMPLTIDATTGQPVLTAATALHDPSGRFVGVTAIDLPLRQLLNFKTGASPWLSTSQLALLNVDDNGQLSVIARKEPLQANSDWRSAQNALPVEGIDTAKLADVQSLELGQSVLLTRLLIGDTRFSAALTAINENGTGWLALLSPDSAIENAVRAALATVEDERRATLQQYLVGAALLVLFVILVALYFAHRVTAPLIRMNATADDLANGQLHSRTGVERSDEIGQLSSSIDSMADSIEQLQEEQEKAYKDMITTLTRALEKKDSYTAGHSGRVTKYALKLGKRIGLDEQTMEKLRFGSLTHDLGKIGIADTILNKPAPLDEAEYQVMKKHPEFSRTIMKPLMRFQEYAEIAGAHHECWDGSGYPQGLKGEQIHLLARIVAIADAWDAMIGDRIYRKGMEINTAIDILDREKDNGQFDPKLIREFIALIREEHGA